MAETKTNVPSVIFREYDIRGIADVHLTYENLHEIARAYATYLLEHGKKKILIAGDVRLSTPRIKQTLISSLLECGISVVDLGVTTTPHFYWSLFNTELDSGIMVTGSHNPPDQNGLKLALDKVTLWGDQIKSLYRIICNNAFKTTGEKGTLEELWTRDRYLEDLKNRISLGSRKLKIVCDCANGTEGFYAKQFFESIGCQVTVLYDDPDGRFPNHHPDPTIKANMVDLQKEVLRQGADFGVGFDGDADRIGVVTDKGVMISGDRLMALFWKEILPKHPGAVGICEVKASLCLPEIIERFGGKVVWGASGHSLIKAKMRELNALFSGEVSGHICFADEYYGFDDALYAAGRLARYMSNSHRSISEELADIPVYPITIETRYPCYDEIKFDVVAKLAEKAKADFGDRVLTVDGARIQYDYGWGLLRASNTQPVLVTRCEARTVEDLQYIMNDMKRRIIEAGSPNFYYEIQE